MTLTIIIAKGELDGELSELVALTRSGRPSVILAWKIEHTRGWLELGGERTTKAECDPEVAVAELVIREVMRSTERADKERKELLDSARKMEAAENDRKKRLQAELRGIEDAQRGRRELGIFPDAKANAGNGSPTQSP